MTEYWVSKKQYWCKYCNIWIRDDAPSRRQHETGLKHQGQKERFIRELYKGGSQAKAEKAQHAVEMARIEALAANAHSKDTGVGYAGRPSVLHAIQAAKAASSSRMRPSEKRDKWANYSTAKELGFDDEDTQKTSYEIEQEIKGRASNHVGAWEEVVDGPHGLYTPPEGASDTLGEGSGVKRKLGEYGVEDEEVPEGWKLEHKGKKAVRDPYADDDWDPKTAFKGLRKKGEGSTSASEVKEELTGLNRSEWTGKLELQPEGVQRRDGLVYISGGGGWVKAEDEEAAEDSIPAKAPNGGTETLEDVKPALEDAKIEAGGEDGKATVAEAANGGIVTGDSNGNEGSATDALSVTNSLFKKRRPPPSSRKK